MRDERSYKFLEQRLWKERLDQDVLAKPGEIEFDKEFLDCLTQTLREREFTNLGFAILCSSAELGAEEGGNRGEFDALMDLALELLNGHRPIE